MGKRKEYIKIIEFGNDIKKIINSWDPLDLLDIAPEDEYETEIREIRDIVIETENINKEILTYAIKGIFGNSFSEEYCFDNFTIGEVAEEILKVRRKYSSFEVVINYNKDKDVDIKKIELYSKIKEIINSWDPLKIMDISLDNEYCYEIKEITGNFNENVNVENLSNLINEVFKNTYNELYNANKNEEIKIAKELNKIGENR